MAALEANLLTIAGGGTKVLFDRAIQVDGVGDIPIIG